jgi:hypothetical protein
LTPCSAIDSNASTAEGIGNFHRCGDKHLLRYCDEFAFRWDNRKVSDSLRRDTALSIADGKRLTYR